MPASAPLRTAGAFLVGMVADGTETGHPERRGRGRSRPVGVPPDTLPVSAGRMPKQPRRRARPDGVGAGAACEAS